MSLIEESAKRPIAQLRKSIGDYPNWKLADMVRFLEDGETEENLRSEYLLMYNIYNEHRPQARGLLERMREEMGKCPTITEHIVFEWMNRKWTESDIMVEYKRKMLISRSQRLHAINLLADVTMEMGTCDNIDKRTVLRWIERGLTDDNIKAKYQWRCNQTRMAKRAEMLGQRISEELGPGLDTSWKSLSHHFEEGRTDEEIFEFYSATLNNFALEDYNALWQNG